MRSRRNNHDAPKGMGISRHFAGTCADLSLPQNKACDNCSKHEPRYSLEGGRKKNYGLQIYKCQKPWCMFDVDHGLGGDKPVQSPQLGAQLLYLKLIKSPL